MSDEQVPGVEPAEIVIGETLRWNRESDDYPASEWALTYSFRGAGKGFDAEAVPDGDTHAVTVAAVTTAEMTPGVYYWQAWAARGAEKYVVASGQARAKRGLAAVTVDTVVDERSKVKQILDAIDDRLAGRAAADVHMYMIGNRQLMKIPVGELLGLRKYYASLYTQERRRERVRKGRALFQNINVRFYSS